MGLFRVTEHCLVHDWKGERGEVCPYCEEGYDYLGKKKEEEEKVGVERKLDNEEKLPSFQAGDVVRLKSGGPKMTIAKLDALEYATCMWFLEPGSHHIYTFPTSVLELVDPVLP